MSKACELTNHVLANMSHGKEFLPAYLTSELFLSVSVDDFIVFVQGPKLLEVFAAGKTLQRNGDKNNDKKKRNLGQIPIH